jgi:predicted nucleotidyltransferase
MDDAQSPGGRDTQLRQTAILHRGAIAMNCDHVIATLRGHELELRAAGVVRLFVFGSTARGDGRPDSDIDLLASFDESRRLSLLALVGIELRLAGLLG